MSLDGNNKDIFREGVIKQTFHFTTMTFQISHLIAFLNIWYKGQILYLTINKAETHTGTFHRIAVFSFLAAWHAPHSPADYICKMAKFFSRLGLTSGWRSWAAWPRWPPQEIAAFIISRLAAVQCSVHVSCTVYSVLYCTHHFPSSWLVAGCGWLYCAELLLAIRVKHIPAPAPQPHWAHRVVALASSS